MQATMEQKETVGCCWNSVHYVPLWAYLLL